MTSPKNPPSKLSRRKFLTGSSATVAGAAVATSGISLFSERAEAFFNMGAFWKKPAGSGQTSNGYTIGQSLRFNGANSYLNRTPSTAGNRKIWTWSGWIKRGSISSQQMIFGATDNNNIQTFLMFTVNNTLNWNVYDSGSHDIYSSRVFRDPAAWYHIVVTVDTTQATASNRVKIYVNGATETFASAVYPNQNMDTAVNINNLHTLGSKAMGGAGNYVDGYLAEVNFIDGQALDASSFGQIDTQTGQWIPKSYSGSYGANGFYLKFADASDTTAATLGKDSAALGGAHTAANNWTPNGFQTHDQVLDSPTNNFCTINPVDRGTNTAFLTISRGNLRSVWSNDNFVNTTFWLASGKWYWEWTCVSRPSWSQIPGITNSQGSRGSSQPYNCYAYNGYNGQKFTITNGATASYSAYGSNPTWGSGDVVGVALDMDAGQLTFYVNGVSKGLHTTGLAGSWSPCVYGNDGTAEINFGQGGQTGLVYNAASGGRFKYAPPNGFKALCTMNLTAPTIKMPAQYFNAVTYTGNGASQTISSLAFQPDLLWFKDRTSGQSHALQDSVRGAGAELQTDTTNGDGGTGGLTSINSNGFTISNGTRYNTLNDNYITWSWKKGAAAGFDIVSYTGDGTNGRIISHELGRIPAFIVLKKRSTASNWAVAYCRASAWTGQTLTGMYLNTTDRVGASVENGLGVSVRSPTSISIDAIGAPNALEFSANSSGDTYVAYLWAEVPDFSMFGSYTGNGSSDGPFVYCGFKPRYVWVKRTDSTENWVISDNSRTTFNNGTSQNNLIANRSVAEAADDTLTFWDVLSNGFKIRSTGTGANASGGNYIFAAFAEAPFKYATAR